MKRLLWSDNWWIEGNRGWFVAGEINALFEVDLIEEKCQFLSLLPIEEIYEFRFYPRCIKFLDKIICIPDRGSCFLIYNLNHKNWKKILINNPNKVRIGICDFWIKREMLWCVSKGLKQIIRVNLENEDIEEIQNIDIESDIELSGSIMIGKNIYVISAKQPEIYIFKEETKSIEVIKLEEIKGNLLSISYDGQRFWLSGFKNEIYIWDKDKNKVEIINKFPDGFGTYKINGEKRNKWNGKEYIFLSHIHLDGKIFLISKYANQILCINKDNYSVNLLVIENEEQAPEEVEKQTLSHKYLFEYIRDDRYIGIYSLKNQEIFEIDAYELKEISRPICFTKKTMIQIENLKLLNYIKTVVKNKKMEQIGNEGIYHSNGEKVYFEIRNA